MDKKSIIGLVLVFGLFVGYMYWVSPSKEEMARMKAEHDSIVAAKVDSIIQDSIFRAERAAMLDSMDEQEVDLALRQSQLGMFGSNVALEASSLTVRNDLFSVELSDQGAQVNKVVLNKFQTFDDKELVLISPSEENMNMVFSTTDNHVVNTRDLHFTAFVDGQPVQGSQEIEVEGDSLVVSYKAYVETRPASSQPEDSILRGDGAGPVSTRDAYLEYAYTFYKDRYDVGFSINFHGLKEVVRADNGFVDFQWQNTMNRQEKVDPSARGKANPNKDREKWYSNVYYRSTGDKPEELKQARDDQKQVNTQLDWVAFKQQFFCAILMNDSKFENAVLANQTLREKDTTASYLCDMSAILGLTYDPDKDCSVDMQFYFGPSKFSTLKKMDRGFEAMLSHGKFFLVRWVSRALLWCLNLFEGFNWNYGLILILITFILRYIVLFPLTYNSYKTSAITRILRPEMEALNKKFPNPEQAMQKSQEMSRLQKSAGINPLMGCLPLLIQLPILSAMFRFIPVSVELRQKPFLWCHDLSNYDSVLDFGFNIPLYGDHFSLFCFIMFVMQFLYSVYTMKSNAANNSMPGMKFMMYFTPFMMLFMFNSQSAGLNLYYSVSLICTVSQMLLIRRFTSEKKVRARMAAYQLKQQAAKKGGKGGAKKSKFQQRLEEMQKLAEQQQRMQQQQKRK